MRVLKKDLQEAAKFKGDTRFRWHCAKHGEQDFSVSGGNCLSCQKDKRRRKRKELQVLNPRLSRTQTRLSAWKKGSSVFLWECPHHGMSEYHVSSDGCIACNKQYRKDNAAYIFARSVLQRLGSDKQEAFSGITKEEAESLSGYSQEDFSLHIESTFKVGMSWDDRASFHIDHILPVAWFKSQGICDVRLVNSLNNLEALAPSDNIRKKANFQLERISEQSYFDWLQISEGVDWSDVKKAG